MHQFLPTVQLLFVCQGNLASPDAKARLVRVYQGPGLLAHTAMEAHFGHNDDVKEGNRKKKERKNKEETEKLRAMEGRRGEKR